MSRKSRYSTEFKQDAVSRMGQGRKTVTALAEELGVRRKFLYLWRERLQAGGKSALERGPGRLRIASLSTLLLSSFLFPRPPQVTVTVNALQTTTG
jgi:transposase-like protein